MGKTYLMERGGAAAHLPVLAVRPYNMFAIGENNNA